MYENDKVEFYNNKEYKLTEGKMYKYFSIGGFGFTTSTFAVCKGVTQEGDYYFKEPRKQKAFRLRAGKDKALFEAETKDKITALPFTTDLEGGTTAMGNALMNFRGDAYIVKQYFLTKNINKDTDLGLITITAKDDNIENAVMLFLDRAKEIAQDHACIRSTLKHMGEVN